MMTFKQIRLKGVIKKLLTLCIMLQTCSKINTGVRISLTGHLQNKQKLLGNSKQKMSY